MKVFDWFILGIELVGGIGLIIIATEQLKYLSPINETQDIWNVLFHLTLICLVATKGLEWVIKPLTKNHKKEVIENDKHN